MSFTKSRSTFIFKYGILALGLALAQTSAGAESPPAPTEQKVPAPKPSPQNTSKPKKKPKSSAKAPAKPAPAKSPAPKPTPPAAAVRTTPGLPPLLQEVETKYAQAQTLYAEFTQENMSEALGQQKTSFGVILVKRPNKVRWQTNKPDQSLLVSDGRKFWYYTPPFEEGENGQLIEKKSSHVQSRLAHALLSGSFSMAKDMKITKEGDRVFLMTPTRKGSAGSVLKAYVTIEPERRLITQVILEHQGGNRSEISLSNIELGKPLGDEMFHFVPPPNTDRVTE